MAGDGRDETGEGPGRGGEARDWTDAELARLPVTRPPGGAWGCGLGALFFLCCLPLAGAMMMMGGGGPPGAKNATMFEVLGAAVAAGGMLALAVRALINGAWRWRGGGSRRVPPWAVAVALAGCAALIWIWYGYWLRGA